MKIIIGIVLVSVLILGLAAYLILMLNAREMIFCGDIKNQSGADLQVTRVYTTDLNANETLSEIILKMNQTNGDSVPISDITEVLAQYQNIIYAPVVSLSAEQADTATYVINGSVLNGLAEDGTEAVTDYRYKDMQISAIVTNGRVLAAQNVYDQELSDQQTDDGKVFKERQTVIEPIVTGADSEASFALTDCTHFRLIVNSSDFQQAPEITFVFIYNVNAENPLDFTSVTNDSLAVSMKMEYDDNGDLKPTYEFIRTLTEEEAARLGVTVKTVTKK